MNSSVLQKGQIVTLLTSYCVDDSQGRCTDRQPCVECVSMCNTYELTERVVAEYRGEVKNTHKTEEST